MNTESEGKKGGLLMRFGLPVAFAAVVAALGVALSGKSLNGAPVARADLTDLTDPARRVLGLMRQPLRERLATLRKIDAEWTDDYTPLLIEILRFSRDPATLKKS